MKYVALLLGLIGSRAEKPALPGQIIDITGGKYFFQAPAKVRPGLTTIRFRAVGIGHQIDLYRLESGHTVTDLVRAASADEPTPWAIELGGPGFPPKNGTVNAIYILEPGQYAILCGVRENGKPHYEKGMYSEFTVTGKRVPGALPKPDVVITEIDNEWRFSRPVTPGRHVIRVTNAGQNHHELKFFRVLPGHTAQESLAWKRGDPKADEEYATVSTMGPGVSVMTTIDFPPGEYTLFCVPQLKKGMKQAMIVKR